MGSGSLKKYNRINELKYNNQGCLMKIVEYNNANDIIVEFQDKYMARIHTKYQHFLSGNIKNPYHPSVYEVGTIGNKYYNKNNSIKEYEAWFGMLTRCYDKKYKDKYPTYQNAVCCDEWLYFDNFYEWLHNQPNFDKWLNGERWSIDKDILVKRNKIYSPETCCLVPQNVNSLFVKTDKNRGNFPIGVTYDSRIGKYITQCKNQLLNGSSYRNTYNTPEKAFYSYKKYKENLIKQVAEKEYDNGNITKQCYDAMMNYEVEITD